LEDYPIIPGVDILNEVGGKQVKRLSYVSAVDGLERDYFLYLPKGYEENPDKNWPVLLFLHGDGERGDGKEELDYVLKYGPLYEAWIQKRDLPFIIVSPQLHMFGRNGAGGPDYIVNRTRVEIPERLAEGVPQHNTDAPARQLFGPMVGAEAAESVAWHQVVDDSGWHNTDPDLITILDLVLAGYNADANRVYLTGVSMGGFGTWYYASRYPEKFAAIVPVVAYPLMAQAEAVARAGIPAWVFSGGRDTVVQTQYFFPGLNRLEELGGKLRFTTEQDMGHDVWNRTYAGEDIYNWLLQHTTKR
jgi:predicted peptidase